MHAYLRLVNLKFNESEISAPKEVKVEISAPGN
jgi:hypothetical protein